MIEPREPKYQWGQPVVAAIDLYNDGSLPDAPEDALLVAQHQSVAGDGQTVAMKVRSIKSYVQLGKLILMVAAAIIAAATLFNRSPLIVLSGLGAMSAVLMLVFKDTILSFTAGVLLSSNDMLRLGDWIEMPQVGADGDVVDIALHTVKVQNWDKTITTIPTWRLVSESYRNWRGMSEWAGGASSAPCGWTPAQCAFWKTPILPT